MTETEQCPAAETKLLYGLKELANFLHVTEKTAFQYKKLKRIPCYQVGRSVIFDPEKVLKALERKAK